MHDLDKGKTAFEVERDIAYRNQSIGDSTIKLTKEQVRQFSSGATRDSDSGKLDFEGFLSPIVLVRYAEYMHKCRRLENGELRSSDNWTKGIPKKQYAKSLIRHMMDIWLISRGFSDSAVVKDIEEALCAVLFNAMGLLFEILMRREIE